MATAPSEDSARLRKVRREHMRILLTPHQVVAGVGVR
jgi:hypothetical protein